jgi:hypothetical protein
VRWNVISLCEVGVNFATSITPTLTLSVRWMTSHKRYTDNIKAFIALLGNLIRHMDVEYRPMGLIHAYDGFGRSYAMVSNILS